MRSGEILADGAYAAEMLVIAKTEPDAVGEGIHIFLKDFGGFLVLRHIVKKVSRDGQKVRPLRRHFT